MVLHTQRLVIPRHFLRSCIQLPSVQPSQLRHHDNSAAHLNHPDSPLPPLSPIFNHILYLANFLLFPRTLQFFHPYLVLQVHFPNQLRFQNTSFRLSKIRAWKLWSQTRSFTIHRGSLTLPSPFFLTYGILTLSIQFTHYYHHPIYSLFSGTMKPNFLFHSGTGTMQPYIYIFLVGYYATRYLYIGYYVTRCYLHWVLSNSFTTFWVLHNPVSFSLVWYYVAMSFFYPEVPWSLFLPVFWYHVPLVYGV